MRTAPLRLAASFCLLASILACGLDGPQATPEGELMGSCDTVATFGSCQEFDDGGVFTAAERREGCVTGAWRDRTPCPREGRSAVCRMEGSFGGARTYYYGSGPNALDHTDLRAACDRASMAGQRARYEEL